MSDPCTIETGLLRKKPCGAVSVTQCLNCERALCAAHAVAEMGASGKKTGKFLCKECHVAWKEADKNAPPPMAAPGAPAAKPAAKPAAGAAAPKPAAATVTAKTAAPKEAPKEEKKPDDSAPLEFTPSKK